MKLKHEEPLSNFASKFNLRLYSLVWGISPTTPIDRREYPRKTNPTELGDIGDASWANTTRMSVGARCFLVGRCRLTPCRPRVHPMLSLC